MIYPEYEARLKQVKSRPIEDIKAEIFEGFEDFVGTKAQIEAREAELKEAVEKARRESDQAYADQYNKIISEFAAELSKAYGTEVEKVDDAIYSAAYDRGHSGGLGDVESAYMGLVEIGKVALEAGMEIQKNVQNSGYLD